MMIRPLTLDELPCCLEGGKAFHTEKHLPGRFDEAHWLRVWTAFLATTEAVIFGLWSTEGQIQGALGAMIVPDLSDGRRAAMEMFWYVHDGARKGWGAWKLLDAFERWGAEHDVVEWRLTHLLLPGESPSTVRLAPLYERRGYRPLEVSFVKLRQPKEVSPWLSSLLP